MTTSYERQKTLWWRRKTDQGGFLADYVDLSHRNELMFTDVSWFALTRVSSTVQIALRKVLLWSQLEPISKYVKTKVPRLKPLWDLLGLRTQVFCEILGNALSQRLIPMSLKEGQYIGLATFLNFLLLFQWLYSNFNKNINFTKGLQWRHPPPVSDWSLFWFDPLRPHTGKHVWGTTCASQNINWRIENQADNNQMEITHLC